MNYATYPQRLRFAHKFFCSNFKDKKKHQGTYFTSQYVNLSSCRSIKGTTTSIFGRNPLIPQKLLFSFPSEIFSLKPVFGACLYTVSNSGSLYTYNQTQRKVNLVLVVAFQCLLIYVCNDSEFETATI